MKDGDGRSFWQVPRNTHTRGGGRHGDAAVTGDGGVGRAGDGGAAAEGARLEGAVVEREGLGGWRFGERGGTASGTEDLQLVAMYPNERVSINRHQ